MADTLDILHITTVMGQGGADKQILDLSKEYIRRGHSVQIICLRPIGPMGKSAIKQGIPVKSLNLSKDIKSVTDLVGLIKSAREFDPDIVHGHMFHGNILARLTRPFLDASAIISTIHNIDESYNKRRKSSEYSIREKIYRSTDRLCDLTTHVSQAGKERYVYLKAIPESKCQVVPNGIRTNEYEFDKKEREELRDRYAQRDFVWLAVGRFIPQKDYKTMIQSFNELKEQDTELWIIGKGSRKSDIQNLVDDLNVDGVKFLGTFPSEQIPSFMSAADGFVLSSHLEGFGIVLIEAMACKLPTVVTRSGGPEDIVVDGRTGYICPSKNPDELSKAMERYMELSPRDRKKMGEYARQRVEHHYDINDIAEEWLSIYNEYVV